MSKAPVIAIALALGLLAGCSRNDQTNQQVRADNPMVPMHDMIGNAARANSITSNGMMANGVANMMGNQGASTGMPVPRANTPEHTAVNEHAVHDNKTDR